MAGNKELKYTLSLKDLFSKKMSGAIGQTKKMDSSMSRLSGAMSGLLAGASIVGFGRAVIESLKNYEYFSASLRVLMKGDRDAAGALQGQLVNLAKTTPFSLVDVQDSSKKLLAYGFAAGDVVRQMRILGDVSAATGNQIGDVAYLYGTLRTQGKAMTKDLYQFTNRGINIIPLLAKQFKILESQVYDYAKAGKIGFKDVERAFVTMTSKGGDFFNMMNEQSKTVGGRLSNMGDAWEQLKVNIGKSQSGIIASTVNWANETLNKLNDVIAQLNRMDEAFNAAKINGYSTLEKFNNWLFMGSQNKFINDNFTGGKGKMEMLDRSVQNMYVEPSGRDKISALGSLKDLLKLKVNFGKAFTNKEIDKTEYERSMALFEQAQKTIQGNIRLFDTNKLGNQSGLTEEMEGKTTGNESSKSLGSSTEVSGARPQSLIININDGLVKQMNIYTTTLKETTSKVREEVAKALLEVANDANLAAR